MYYKRFFFNTTSIDYETYVRNYFTFIQMKNVLVTLYEDIEMRYTEIPSRNGCTNMRLSLS